MVKKIAIFASGQGSNAKSICAYFSKNAQIKVALIGTNKPDAGVLEHAVHYRVPTLTFTRKQLWHENFIHENLLPLNLDLIVLAGFLLLIPPELVAAFPDKIINIHPALLPDYGGKGMYGMHVHRAVKRSGDKESGITIHYVNEHYDEGQYIVQEKCPVYENDSPEEIASRVLKLEHYHFPRVVEKILLQ